MEGPENIFYRRSSIREEQLTRIQKLFLSYVKAGDTQKVADVLKENPGVLNSVDFRGVSALHLALTHKHVDMAIFLISHRTFDVRDCILHAIKLNKPAVVKLIIKKFEEFEVKHNFERATILSLPCVNSSAFPDYMTPLMLAAQCGSVEVVDLLLISGHPHIPEPHRPGCLCEDCVIALKDDPLKMNCKRYETFKAFCNPAYIFQREEDPILEAFYLVKEMKIAALRSRVFLSKYRELIEQTERFAGDLVAQCRNKKEVEIILSEKKGLGFNADFSYPRLLLAVHYKQRYFVTQRNVQIVLLSEWSGDWYAWRSYGKIRQTISFFGRILVLPVFYITYIFVPNSRLANFFLIPLNRMISSVASYIFFLFLCFIGSTRNKKEQTRYDIQYQVFWQFFIFLYWVSHFTRSVRRCIIQGPKRFLRFRWNLYDVVMEIIFFMTLSFWTVAHLILYSQPDLERKNWHYLDPQLLAEGLFCIGTVMAFMRLFWLLQTEPNIGPLHVSVGRMTNSFFKFSVIFLMVIGSFTIGLSHLYEYYDGMKNKDPNTKIQSAQKSSFVSITSTFKSLFWAPFFQISVEDTYVVIDNLPKVEGELEDINTHDFTEAVGCTMYALFVAYVLIFFVNMLTAVLSDTYDRTIGNVAIHWTYCRTEVYLTYMTDFMFPSPISMLFQRIFKKSDKERRHEYGDKEYYELIKVLFHRYFKKEEDDPGETSTSYMNTVM